MAIPAATHSKTSVNRAGRLLRDWWASDIDEVDDDAIDTVEWWRARHAKPLARVNANLRYYVKKVGIAEPYVTQRLKRFATIIDKLDRHHNMQLSTMEDIGGVRGVLPNQKLVDAVVDDLRRQRKWQIRRVREYVEGRYRARKRTATEPCISPLRRMDATSRSSYARHGRTRGRNPSSKIRVA